MKPNSLVPVFVCIITGSVAAPAATIYWSDVAGVHRANDDGSDMYTLPIGYASDLQLDVENGKVYWADPLSRTINRADFDGTGMETLISDTDRNLESLAVDVEGAWVYWTEVTPGFMFRAKLDGTQRELISPISSLWRHGVELNREADQLYITGYDEAVAGDVFRTNVDGSNPVGLFNVVGGGMPGPILIDSEEGKLYTAELFDDTGHFAKILRANLDGSDVETLVAYPVATVASGIALDDRARKLYWTLDEALKGQSIRRSNLDGTDQELVFDVAALHPFAIAVDGSLPGDANGDGLVNLEDFNSLKTNFGAGSKRSQGDFNADHLVDLVDFNILKTNFGSGGAAVPEPSAWCLAGAAFSGALLARYRARVRRS